jgi:Protein of unknown function (DUF1549)/Protein of unknown function (DUF1553)/Concanavalin A-like lectin/glucanases superfamily/Planctomycete cytochrome C
MITTPGWRKVLPIALFVAFIAVGYQMRGQANALATTQVVAAAFPAPGQSVAARSATDGQAPAVRPLVFGRDIRPLLSDRCFSCHGPDPAKRSAGLRLDLVESATGPLPQHQDQRAIVPGNPGASALIKRITSADPLQIMPPANSHLTLNQAERDLLTRWIAEGAHYAPHFAYVTPVAPAVPPVSNPAWARHDLDRFILARLDEQGLKPAGEADPATLLRRVSLDLTGLPPTPDELAAFLADTRPDAYERQVDRLLASPRYGEHLAAWWLDLARYADSHGFQSDPERFMWLWRDWVINAFNRNMPFDQFTIEQLAGDLLPNATIDQVIATGFNRNHRINSEGGAIDEEWRIEQVLDRSETTSAVWLGLTMNCCRCHDHKYDPLTQKDYYQFAAFFNNVDEKGVDVSINSGRNVPPLAYKATVAQQSELDRINGLLAKAEAAQAAAKDESLDAKAKAWVSTGAVLPAEPTALATVTLAGALAAGERSTGSASVAWLDRGTGKALALRKATGGVRSQVTPAFDLGKPFSISWWMKRDMNAGKTGAGTLILAATGVADEAIHIHLDAEGKLQADIRAAGFHFAQGTAGTAPGKEWGHVAVTWDGSGRSSGLNILIDGQFQRLVPMKREIPAAGPIGSLLIGSDGKREAATTGIAEVRIFARELTTADIAALGFAERIAAIRGKPYGKSEAELAEQVYRLGFTPQEQLAGAVLQQQRDRDAIEREVPNTMVMKEMPKPRPMHILERGQYDAPRAEVTMNTPAFLPPLPADAPRNRLGLARWLVDERNPLTARVLVNRIWERFFGTGIVKTAENLGVQCNWPSHPELLDHLATVLVGGKWDLKAFLRLLVTSATYRQDATVTPVAQEQDPENLLLWHGPRVRLAAEVVRDQALLASGLLVEHLGGPSVRPYQPADIWSGNRFGNLEVYQLSTGDDLYRRSLYTFHKRTAPPINSTLFDMPSREFCVIRRSRTNTPLQALNLANDPTYLEAARVIGQQMVRGGGSPEAQVAYAIQHILARAPRSEETTVLVAALARYTARYAQDPAATAALLKQGASPVDATLKPAAVVAAMLVASTILNLDEAVTKP